MKVITRTVTVKADINYNTLRVGQAVNKHLFEGP